jgi:hypothetical protein
VRRRSKNLPPDANLERRRPSSDLAVPGGPMKRICSPASAAKRRRRTSVSRSMRPLEMVAMADWRRVRREATEAASVLSSASRPLVVAASLD